MKPKLNMNKIAKGLRAERRGPVKAGAGYFGALALAAEANERFRVPEKGGRATDPAWTERRQVPLTPETLERLESLTAKIRERGGTNLHPMQLAALLLEKAAEDVEEEEASDLAQARR